MHASELFGLEADHRLFMLPFEFVLQDDTIRHWTVGLRECVDRSLMSSVTSLIEWGKEHFNEDVTD